MSFSKTDRSKIHAFIDLFPVQTEISVAKIVDAKPSYFGLTKTENGLSEVNNKSDIYEIGSITKVFTSSVLASKVTKGELSLDHLIDQCLPLNLKSNQEISLLDLATHYSGLPFMPPGIIWQALFKNKENPTKNYHEKHLLDYLENHLKLRKKKIAYSNLGVGLLGYVLRKMSGKTYDELLKGELFNPLNMTNSTSNRNNVVNRLVSGLDTKGKVVEYSDLGILEGAGAVLSSAEDLVKFSLANFSEENKFLSLQRKAVVEDKYQCMALGWLIVNKPEKGERMYFHDGGTRGFSSAMYIDVHTKTGIILLSNISGLHKMKGNKSRKLVRDLMNDQLGEEEK